LDLRLHDSRGNLVGNNFYWLSAKAETLAWEKSTYYVTPTAAFADFSALQQLPSVSLKLKSRTERKGGEAVTRITVENSNSNLAFFVQLKIADSIHGAEILPVVWQDNYFSLLPKERREIRATYRLKASQRTPVIEVCGWNVKPDAHPIKQ
jgi:exo-1,4-beta-D-glucosaminidase